MCCGTEQGAAAAAAAGNYTAGAHLPISQPHRGNHSLPN